MRAVVVNGTRDVSVEKVADPVLAGPDGAIVQVTASALCGSDLHFYEGEFPAVGLRPGHEVVGTVVEIGADVGRIAVGDRVLVSPVIGCGRCPGCRAGNPIDCVGGGVRVLGGDVGLPGGHAEAVAVPAADAWLLPVPEDVSVDHAVLLTDALPTGWTAATRADITPGATVLVIGLGPVGLYALQAAQVLGAGRILAADRVPERLAMAERLGAEPIDATRGDVAEQVRAATAGLGADAVIEAVGQDATLSAAIASVRSSGTVSVVGVDANFAFPIAVPLLLIRNVTLRFTTAPVAATWPTLIPLIRHGRLVPVDVFTHRMPLSEAAVGYRTFADRTDGCLKVLFDPTR
ncbi:zinc-binding dehydrogenase [Embleya sp. NPDC020630]|uniref:zinc-binding dehydrogenase n=1 Tax=Embleya sp. NPDC020630 TaxID=3363979 RepID=UPI00378BBF85